MTYNPEIRLLPGDMKKINQMAVKAADEFSKRDPLVQKAWESQKEYLKFMGKMK